MIPWAKHYIVAVKGILLFHVMVHQLRTIDIFLVEIAADVQHRDLRLPHVTQWGVLLPEGIIVGMFDKVVPGGDLAVEVFLINIL